MRRTQDVVWLVVLLAVIGIGGFWFLGRQPTPPTPVQGFSALPQAAVAPPADLDSLRKPDAQAVVLETTQGKIVFELYPNAAPNHVAQIKALVQKKYYDGLLFHRVIPGFMIQFGDPLTRGPNQALWGTGGSDQPKLKAEFNDLPHVPGTVSMARTNDPDSATTQFFICVGTPSFLDHQYTVFGHVLNGQAVADAISRVPRNPLNVPNTPIRVTRAYLIPHP